MKKWIVRALILLAVNVVVFVLTIVSLFLLLETSDFIISGAIALVALPFILLQPWSIVFALIPPLIISSIPVAFSRLFLVFFVFLPAPLYTTIVTILLWHYLDKKGKLERIKPFAMRLKSRKTLIAAGCMIFWLCAIAFSRYIDFPALNRGVPPILQEQFKDSKICINNSLYLHVDHFLAFDCVMRATISESDLRVLTEKLKMSAIPTSEVHDEFWNMRPYWWRPMRAENTLSFATDNFRNMKRGGPDDLYFLATWNPDDKIVHLWIKEKW